MTYKKFRDRNFRTKLESSEKSERQRGKKEVKNSVEEFEKEDDLKELQYEIEMKMAFECHVKEAEANIYGLEYKCTCEDPYKWSKEKCLEYLGL